MHFLRMWYQPLGCLTQSVDNKPKSNKIIIYVRTYNRAVVCSYCRLQVTCNQKLLQIFTFRSTAACLIHGILAV